MTKTVLVICFPVVSNQQQQTKMDKDRMLNIRFFIMFSRPEFQCKACLQVNPTKCKLSVNMEVVHLLNHSIPLWVDIIISILDMEGQRYRAGKQQTQGLPGCGWCEHKCFSSCLFWSCVKRLHWFVLFLFTLSSNDVRGLRAFGKRPL